eukprot:TRINITY_DN57902_c0_g1_i1.p1 TRINITY_DN57902_c0_g1~~TRINITY_DN57902_c0_g1_i1.p1  ORF type:complete len:291 (-),score=49.89 TRINITY_DN57902_c0_g1_i1:135-1007(-)
MPYLKQVLIIILWLPSLADVASDPDESLEANMSCQLLQHRVDLEPVPSSIQVQLRHHCSDECIPAVFVVSSGRSGSATIMHMLNEIPGFDLKGQTKGMMASLRKMQEALDSKYESYKGSPLYAWVHSSDRNESEIRCGLRMMVLGELNPQSNARVVGYKEIDWEFDNKLQDLSLLMDVFPCSKIILSYRNDLEEQLSSMRVAYGEYDYFGVRHANQQIQKFANQHLDRTFRLPLEEFSVGRFNDLLHFLGEDVNCHFVDMIRDNKGETFTQIGEPSDDVIRCAPPAGNDP